MWYLINSWKLLSENPQPPSEKIHSPIFTHCPLPKKSETASPPVFAKIENILDPSPLQKGGGGRGGGRTLCRGRRLAKKIQIERYVIRSSRSVVFCKKGVLKNFAKFTGKHLCQSLFFNKVVGGTCSFIEKKTLAQVFPCEFCKIFKHTFFIIHLWWLLLCNGWMFSKAMHFDRECTPRPKHGLENTPFYQ